MAGVCTLGLSAIAAGVAHAQQEAALEQVTVTGSRIQRDGLSTATPVTAVESEEIQRMAPTLLMDAIDMLPQFRDNDLSNTGGAFASAGANSVNLRGIGGNRTLVLLDGRRVVSSTKNGTVDIALFPQPLVERLEVVTGGASAAYGSDAISGVTNFILDTDFTGFEATVQGGITDRSDRENSQFQISGGTEIGERSHLIASADYFSADAVVGYRGREWFDSWGMINNVPGELPERVIGRPGSALSGSLNGMIVGGPLGGTRFLEDGTWTDVREGHFVNPGQGQFGGSGTDTALDWANVYPEEERYSVFGHWSLESDGGTEYFVQALKGFHEVAEPNQFGTAGPWAFQIQQDNAYLPENLRQRMIEDDIDSFTLGRFLNEVYYPTRSASHDMNSITAGFEKETEGGLRIGAYYQYGETVQIINYAANNMQARTDRLYRAVDAVIDEETGQTVCYSNASQNPDRITGEQEGALMMLSENGVPQFGDPLNNPLCTPMNILGFGSPSLESKQYVWTGNFHEQDVTQHFVEATVQADPFETWAGQVSIVGGVSYREDEVFQDAYPNDIDPRDLHAFATFDDDVVGYRGLPSVVVNEEVFLIGNPNADGTPIQGGFDVREVFGETYVPLYRGDGGRFLDATVGLRYADYSGSGGVWSGKLGLDWQATSDVRFRATYSRDTRAGTLSERFDSQGGGGNIDDPFNPQLDPYLTTVVAGGNPEVDPEEADTVTFGVVYQPSWATGLGLSVDVYDIEIDGAISQLGIQQLVDECFAGATELCGLIEFNEAGEIQVIRDVFVNVAEARTRGIDLEVQYNRPISLFGGDESIGLRAFANYIDEASEQNVGAPKLDQAGSRSIPERVGTLGLTYTRDGFNAYLQQRYIDSSVRDVRWVTGVDISDNHVAGTRYTDLNLSYDMDAGNGSYRFYAHVTNLLDEAPVLTPGGPSTITGATSHTLGGQFDVLGRRYVLGAEFRF